MTRAAAAVRPASERSIFCFIGKTLEVAGCNNANCERLHIFLGSDRGHGFSAHQGIIPRHLSRKECRRGGPRTHRPPKPTPEELDDQRRDTWLESTDSQLQTALVVSQVDAFVILLQAVRNLSRGLSQAPVADRNWTANFPPRSVREEGRENCPWTRSRSFAFAKRKRGFDAGGGASRA